MIKAEIIADSKNPFGQRLTTFVVVFPRIVLAEFNTHRMLSRNSASSRAIPFEKMLKMVQENPFIPIKWMKDHKGMQGNAFFDGMTCSEAWSELDRAFNYTEFKDMSANEYLEKTWLTLRDMAVTHAKSLAELGVTKQIVNRLLEPFMWHTVIVTASEWENFFALRAHPAAEIHIAELADKMLTAYNESTPRKLKEGQWHIPFGDNMNPERLAQTILPQVQKGETDAEKLIDQAMIKIATARCARVSYMNFDGSDDYQKDIELHDRLSEMGHMSPMEHCARAMTKSEYNLSDSRVVDWKKMENAFPLDDEEELSGVQMGWSGNFRGFMQYRKMFENENRTDNRVIKK